MTDFSGKSYLLSKILGGHTPDAQVNINLIINIVTTLASSLLLGFLNGYYDSLYEKTGQTAPPVIYLVYIFLALVMAWQVLSFLINTRLKRKLSGRKKRDAAPEAETIDGSVASASTQKSLPQADFENIARSSVVEDTTKMLDKVPRK